MKTRRTKPTGPEAPLGPQERVAWLVLDVETGSVVGKVARVTCREPGYTDYWLAYAIVETPYGEPPKEPVRLGPWQLLRNAQNEIEQWHTEREDADRVRALREIQEGR